MSTADKLPKAYVTRESLNAEIVDSYSRYTQRVMTVLNWLEKFEQKILKRLEQITDEADSQGENMSPAYQFNVYMKVSDLVLKLEEVRFKLFDKLQGVELPKAPELEVKPRETPLQFKRLAEMVLVAREKYGMTTEAVLDGWAEQAENVLRAQEVQRARSGG